MSAILDWFTGVDSTAEQQRSDAADSALAAQNDAALARGAVNQTQYDMTAANIANQREDVSGDVNQAFVEGAKEGLAATESTIKSAAAAPFKFSWAIIPWQLMLAGVVALFFYAGGGEWLKGILNRKR